MTADVAVVILTYNEALHIERAIRSVAGFASRVIVIDSYSTDDTVRIAEDLGAHVLQNPFVNQAQQFAWGLANAAISEGWILRLDADEVIGLDLANRIVHELPTLPADVAGVTFDRRHIFMGRWIRHGGRYPLTLLRLWRRGQGRVEERWMDEHVVVWGGRTVAFEGIFEDRNHKDISFFTAKHNNYATREAIEVLCERHGLLLDRGDHVDQEKITDQANRKRAIKRIYNRVPFPISALAYFLFRFFIQLGFLDGTPGVVYHVLQGFWYRFLVGAKVTEFDTALRKVNGPNNKLLKLSELTGYNLNPTPLAASQAVSRM